MNPPTYTIRYYDKELLYTTKQILVDAYTVYCGQLLKTNLLSLHPSLAHWCFRASSFILSGPDRERQSTDEITGGRVLNKTPDKWRA